MQIVPTNMTVADYCDAMNARDILVNRDYQRSDQVWPSTARSFLIETILMGFPVPKLSLYQRTDLKTKKTYKEIVDGQQRSTAIVDFFNGKFRLSPSLELAGAAGKKYDDLHPDLQDVFLTYSLTIDLFVSASPEEVRDVFRRMNSYTVPLNPEEQRHASRQGPFKWSINRTSKKYNEQLIEIGVFTPKQVIRMADAKLLTEVTHALYYGITTTSKKKLDDLYKEFDVNYPGEKEVEGRFKDAIGFVVAMPEIHGTSLMKPHVMYALLLAIMHMNEPLEMLEELAPGGERASFDYDNAVSNLTALADAWDNGEDSGDFADFVKASSERTNVKAQRETRFRWLYTALCGDLPL